MGRTEVRKVAVGMEKVTKAEKVSNREKGRGGPTRPPPSRFWGADIPDQWFRNQLHILPTTNGRKETYFWIAAGRKARTVTQCLCNYALQQRWPARKYIKVAWSSDCRRDPCNPPFRSADAQYRNTQACTKTGLQIQKWTVLQNKWTQNTGQYYDVTKNAGSDESIEMLEPNTMVVRPWMPDVTL